MPKTKRLYLVRSEPPHKDIARTQEWVDGMIKGNNGITDFVICLKPDLKPIGKIGVWQGDEIGFLLFRSQWGRGLAREALNKVISYLFEEKDFVSISADIDPRNEASLSILKKFGFEVEKYEKNTLQVGDEWVDSVYLMLTKERWQSRQSG